MSSVSRSYQYRKVMKPLLERKRRARINKCLDELKQLIMETVHLDEETLSKLEKADILELTVHHLHRKRQQSANDLKKPQQYREFDQFWCGFRQCIFEVSRFLQRHDTQLNDKFLHTMLQLLPPRPVIGGPGSLIRQTKPSSPVCLDLSSLRSTTN